MTIRRPRAAAIGLDGSQLDAIRRLCGTLREADNWDDYLCDFATSETDVVVASYFDEHQFNDTAHLMVAGDVMLNWVRTDPSDPELVLTRQLSTSARNREHEVKVANDCPETYRTLSAALARQINGSDATPTTVDMPWEHLSDAQVLVETTSSLPVALRCEIPSEWVPVADVAPTVLLALPPVDDLAGWFHAFLTDIHSFDREAVPQPLLRLIDSEEWYSSEEDSVARQIRKVETQIRRLQDERDSLAQELIRQGQLADRGPRRAILDDGEPLVEAIEEILRALGFAVINMDHLAPAGTPKKEDLRLSVPDQAGWEAIVEIKGYSGGTKTNDADQMRRHREQYALDEQRSPDLALWITNPYRTLQPSARPDPDQNVHDKAKIAGAVHVLSTDLYRLWVRVRDGQMPAEEAQKQLMGAQPGCWQPSLLDKKLT